MRLLFSPSRPPPWRAATRSLRAALSARTRGVTGTHQLARGPERRAHERLLRLAALSLLDEGSFADLAAHQRTAMRAGEQLALREVAGSLPGQLGHLDERDVLHPTIRGLQSVAPGRIALEHFPAVLQLALRRYRQGATTLGLRRVRRCLHLSRGQARRVREVVDCEMHVFTREQGRGPARAWRGARWRVDDRISQFAGAESVGDYLAVLDSHPLLAAARARRPAPASPTARVRREGATKPTLREVFSTLMGTLLATLILAQLAIGPAYAPTATHRARTNCTAPVAYGGHPHRQLRTGHEPRAEPVECR